MGRSFQIVEDKVKESDFFLSLLDECSYDGNLFTARYYVSAFLSSSRSITFVLKASLHDLPGFTEWYEIHETRLKESTLAKFFLESRNLSQKVGYYPICGMGSDVDQYGVSRYKFHFRDDFEKKGVQVPQTDVYTACEEYFLLLLEMIYDCLQVHGYDIDPDKYYTEGNMKRLNLCIEDFEEELGFPRGWTNIPGATESARLDALRKSVSTQSIDPILISRLGKDRFGETY